MRVSLFSYHCLPYVHPHKIVTQVHAIAFEHTYSTSYISTLVDKNTVDMIMARPPYYLGLNHIQRCFQNKHALYHILIAYSNAGREVT